MIINGKKRDLPEGTSVREMLAALELDPGKVVVEVNQIIIESGGFGTCMLSAADKVEIIAFVGGG